MNFLRPSSRLLRCAVELRMAVDFMTIGLVYIYSTNGPSYTDLSYSVLRRLN